MKGDFSRQTFDPAKGYTAVLMQQGRVQLDADWNEQQLIHAQRLESALGDVVGATGALKDLAGADGFRVTASNRDVLVAPGVFYVDGIRVENAVTVSVGGPTPAPQPFRTGDAWPPGAAPGTYLVYLDVWQRHVTALEDPAIRETALGGPDTATRLRTIWQVRLKAVAGGTTCSGLGAVMDDITRRSVAKRPGLLGAQPSATSGGGPCLLPADAGYRGLENQLYRVEVQKSGTMATARFKWSRENGSVVTRVVGTAGGELLVEGLGRDEALGFAATQWVELVDDDLDLAGAPGTLLKVKTVKPYTSSIEFDGAVPAIDVTRNPRLRRWDHGGTSPDGVAASGTGLLELEAGVQAQLGEGNFVAGDHWMIPARTATAAGQASVEWPRTGAGPVKLPPHGPRHHYAALALVQGTPDPADTTKLRFTLASDCRPRFPSLTQITAADVRYDNAPCQVEGLPPVTTVQAAVNALCQREWEYGITISPMPGWPTRFGLLDPAAGGHVRFKPGAYSTTTAVEVVGTGHLTVHGGGQSTRITASGAETALRFRGWKSVTVRGLYAEALVVGDDGATRDLNGVLSFVDCGEVTVEDVTLKSANGEHRSASCVDVRHTFGGPNTLGTRIRGCRLEVGNAQVGALVVNAPRLLVEDNQVRGPSGAAINLMPLLGKPEYTRWLTRALIRGLVTQDNLPAPSPAPSDWVSVTVGNVPFRFYSVPFAVPSVLVGMWFQLLNDALIAFQQRTGTTGTPGSLNTVDGRWRFARDSVARAVSDSTLLNKYQPLKQWLLKLSSQNLPAAAQGIVVAGRSAGEMRISGNTVTRVGEAIHVGLGDRHAGVVRQRAGNVQVTGNTVEGWASPVSPYERYGIYVSGADTLRVEGNDLTLQRPTGVPGARVEAIRVRGGLGRLALVRANQALRYSVGVFALPQGDPATLRRWLIADNLVVDAQHTVEDPRALFEKVGNKP
jgi:hypothetical protein